MSTLYPNHNNLSSRMRKSNTIYKTIKGNILADSGKAIKFCAISVSDIPLKESITVWIPVSQCTKIFKDPNTVGQDTLTVAEWILKDKGMI